MTTVEEVREAARRLPPVEQFQLIQELLRGLERIPDPMVITEA